jgi:serine/threonine protein phosphatase PrpC
MNRWNSWGASVTGPGHVRNGIPNQDAWAVEHYAWGDVLVVSDGLGSCPHAEAGSRAACEAVKQAADFFFRNRKWESPDLPGLIQIFWRILVFPLSPEECSATCLFVIRENGGRVLLGMLGDGLLASVKADGSVELLVANKDDSFSNFTTSLSSTNASADWRILRSSESGSQGFLLCTDGIADDLLPDSVESFVKASMAHYRNCSKDTLSADLQHWLENWPVPGHSDDKTIACLFHAEETNE